MYYVLWLNKFIDGNVLMRILKIMKMFDIFLLCIKIFRKLKIRIFLFFKLVVFVLFEYGIYDFWKWEFLFVYLIFCIGSIIKC